METKTFREVVKELGNKSYPRVELRLLMNYKGEEVDIFAGVFAYDGDAGRIISLDGDSYSMDMACTDWKEFKSSDGKLCLCVYERAHETYTPLVK